MVLRQTITAFLVLAVLASGHASGNLASALGRADFGLARKADERRSAALA